jgi:hypothetical protein
MCGQLPSGFRGFGAVVETEAADRAVPAGAVALLPPAGPSRSPGAKAVDAERTEWLFELA